MPQEEEVFISYSHDSELHMDRVRELSDRLRAEGVDCDIDQYHEAPPEGWPRWMAKKVRDSKFVLVVCSRPYQSRFEGLEEKGKGLGAKWEGSIIINELYEAEGSNTKFIPVIFDFADREFIPTPLRPTTYYNVGKQSGFEDLYGRLTGQQKIKKPVLGSVRKVESQVREALPSKEVKTKPQAFLITPIDIELWNLAKWRATFFLVAPEGPPMLGLAFRNAIAGKKIFEGWRDRYGVVDEHDELRISTIAETNQERPQDYAVTVSADLDVVHARLEKLGLFNEGDAFLGISRINHMEPISEQSSGLPIFRKRFEECGEYVLIPGQISADNSNLRPFVDLGIRKKKVLFRKLSDIGEGDHDLVILSPEDRDKFLAPKE
ncbi:hypothetical protein os4_27060 [Comamonadaceae bacterium OS-4]|nr:hypothetical protein os4_27060 [Comamonadaceae bacterium OS-4]